MNEIPNMKKIASIVVLNSSRIDEKQNLQNSRIKEIRALCKSLGVKINSWKSINKIVELYYNGSCKPITQVSRGYTDNTEDILNFCKFAKIDIIGYNTSPRGGKLGNIIMKKNNK